MLVFTGKAKRPSDPDFDRKRRNERTNTMVEHLDDLKKVILKLMIAFNYNN